jgi:hypothetical protein
MRIISDMQADVFQMPVYGAGVPYIIPLRVGARPTPA